MEVECFLPKKSASNQTTSRVTNDRCFVFVNKRPVCLKEIEKVPTWLHVVKAWHQNNVNRIYWIAHCAIISCIYEWKKDRVNIRNITNCSRRASTTAFSHCIQISVTIVWNYSYFRIVVLLAARENYWFICKLPKRNVVPKNLSHWQHLMALHYRSLCVICLYLQLLRQSYTSGLGCESGRYPMAYLHILASPDCVDVNVDPNKTKVMLHNKVGTSVGF